MNRRNDVLSARRRPSLLLLITGALVAVGARAQEQVADDPLALAQQAIGLVQQATAKPEESEERFQALQAAAARALDARGALGLIKQPTGDQKGAVERAIRYVAVVAPKALELKGVSHYFQSNDSLCALASARMVLTAAGIQVTEADLVGIAGARVGPEGLHVSFFNNALAGVGLEAITGVGDTELLRCALVAGRPVAVFQTVTLDRNVQHMRVVVGYDQEAGQWFTLDPAPQLGPRLVLSEEEFGKLWELKWRADGSAKWFGLVWRARKAEP